MEEEGGSRKIFKKDCFPFPGDSNVTLKDGEKIALECWEQQYEVPDKCMELPRVRQQVYPVSIVPKDHCPHYHAILHGFSFFQSKKASWRRSKFSLLCINKDEDLSGKKRVRCYTAATEPGPPSGAH